MIGFKASFEVVVTAIICRYSRVLLKRIKTENNASVSCADENNSPYFYLRIRMFLPVLFIKVLDISFENLIDELRK